MSLWSRSMPTAITLLAMSACSHHGVNPNDINQLVEVSYAKVLATKPITFDSKADEAAAMGALEGAIDAAHYGDGDDVVAGAIGGALVSALMTSLEEGGNKGLLLTLKDTDEQALNLLVKRKDIVAGDCLRLIQGESVSIDHVEPRYCEKASLHTAK
ncbi:hypothetical protein FLL45_07165 [Aliikangiella marina]|uniref:Glycine zipper 2TM domain-containing protein n=1 Tax=Aliikangiella marina TaxID=1712262 RepID=A0A545TC02_9GAMM|nr:hypothetical protein [Aliikangiella marina]TQV74734.1 hypothetical protein FLL45_07165 [Aliikangiella marina]